MNKIYEILEDHIHIVRGEIQKEFNTTNGIADPVIVETIKSNYLKENLAHLTNILVQEDRIHYPNNNKVVKDFKMMFAVIKNEHLMELIKEIEYLEDRLCKCNKI